MDESKEKEVELKLDNLEQPSDNEQKKEGSEEKTEEKYSQTYDPQQYWNKKWENKENSESAEYHNCIFLDGKDLSNFIFNAGEINGNIEQNRENLHCESSKVSFRKIEDLQIFMKTYSIDDYVSILLVVLTLKIVPVSYLYPIARELKKYVKVFEEETDTEKRTDALLALEDVLDIIGAKKVLAEVKNEAGEMEIQCITLQEGSLMLEAATAVWENYPGLRENLIQWLLSIRTEKEYRQMILYQITEALGNFAAADFAYAKNHIISRFMRNENKDDFYFLKAIMQSCLKSDLYRQNADNLLCHWCTLDNNDFLWEIALALVVSDEGYHFYESVRKRLASVIRRELASGTTLETEQVIYIFKEEPKVSFQILQENREAAMLYLEILTEQFEACGTRKEQLRFGYYFAMLMWQDYIAEGYPDYRSLFIDSLNQKKISKKMRRLLSSAWQRQVFRELWIEPLLGMYIKEYHNKQIPWSYMKRFLQILAFTGKETDYNYTQKMLKRIGKSYGNAITDEMQRYLSGLLNGRRTV